MKVKRLGEGFEIEVPVSFGLNSEVAMTVMYDVAKISAEGIDQWYWQVARVGQNPFYFKRVDEKWEVAFQKAWSGLPHKDAGREMHAVLDAVMKFQLSEIIEDDEAI